MYTERHKDEYVSKDFFFERNSVNSIVKIALIYFFMGIPSLYLKL